jgi:hypothetical protein
MSRFFEDEDEMVELNGFSRGAERGLAGSGHACG